MATSSIGTNTPTTQSTQHTESLSLTKSPKLSNTEVFQRISRIMCSIASTEGESSGFLINNKGDVLTVTHNLPNHWDEVQVQRDQEEIPYFLQAMTTLDQNQVNAGILDLLVLKTQIPAEQIACLPNIPSNFELQVGMKIFFAGYPLGQATATFHKGIISSISKDDQGIIRFTIDGTVVPGNSGGPVVLQYAGNLYLIGVITSEIVDLSLEDQKTIAIMKAMQEQRERNSLPPPPLGTTSTSIAHGDLISSFPITTSEGTEQVTIGNRDTIVLALDLIERNFSSGIGQAIDIRHLANLSPEHSNLAASSRFSYPVRGKGKQLIRGTISQQLKYIEVRYGNGAGNRGIKINLVHLTPGVGPLTYKFSPNPHSEKRYNKDQKALYRCAAERFSLLRLQQAAAAAPQQFNFQAYQIEFTATRQ